MELSKVFMCLMLKTFIITSTRVEGIILDLTNSSQIDDWKFLYPLLWPGNPISNPTQIIKRALPTIASRYFDYQPILEAVVDSDSLSYSTQKLGHVYSHLYYFVKAVFGETNCLNNKRIDPNSKEACYKQNMAGSLKLCAIHVFNRNIIKCWKMNKVNDNTLINEAREAAQVMINNQFPNNTSLITVQEIERAYHLFLEASEVIYNKVFYLKLKVNGINGISTCSGEIELTSENSKVFHGPLFHCQ